MNMQISLKTVVLDPLSQNKIKNLMIYRLTYNPRRALSRFFAEAGMAQR